MTIDSINLHTVSLDLRNPFATATGVQRKRTLLIVSVASDELVGWGECSADGTPYCRGEDANSARLALGAVARSYLGAPVTEPVSRNDLVASPMAAAAFEAARWDLYAKSIGLPLATTLGGSMRTVPSRAVLGKAINLVDRAAQAVSAGYRSVKVKLSPHDALSDLDDLRSTFPEIGIAVDLNGSASGHRPTSSFWAGLDDLNLEFVEQPFDPSDNTSNLALAGASRTPICLDESVRSADQAAWAIEHGFLVNLKAAKFGGPGEARRIVRAASRGRAWWGGMLETGIGRAHAIALATLPGPTLASDLAGSERYYVNDLTDPFQLHQGGLQPVNMAGIGVNVDTDLINAISTRSPDRYS